MRCKYIRMEVGSGYLSTVEAKIEVINSSNTTIKIDGELDKWALYHLARACVEGMKKIRNCEKMEFERSERLIDELSGS